ncbi:hypothetical protein ACNKHQ_21730 [Shigella flexneri]
MDRFPIAIALDGGSLPPRGGAATASEHWKSWSPSSTKRGKLINHMNMRFPKALLKELIFLAKNMVEADLSDEQKVTSWVNALSMVRELNKKNQHRQQVEV